MQHTKKYLVRHKYNIKCVTQLTCCKSRVFVCVCVTLSLYSAAPLVLYLSESDMPGVMSGWEERNSAARLLPPTYNRKCTVTYRKCIVTNRKLHNYSNHTANHIQSIVLYCVACFVFTFIFSSSESFHLSIVTERTKLCVCM